MGQIRDAVEQTVRHLEGEAGGSAPDSAATAVREEGLRVRVSGPDGDVATDMAKAVGGGGTAPSPGWLMRAALASCDASMLALEAAREGVELTALEVRVESDSDIRGLLGVGDGAPAGPTAIRTHIRVAGGADGERLREIVASALERSPVKDALGRSVDMTTEVSVG